MSNNKPILLIELVRSSSFSETEKWLPVFQMQIAYNMKSIRKEICSQQICLVVRFTPLTSVIRMTRIYNRPHLCDKSMLYLWHSIIIHLSIEYCRNVRSSSSRKQVTHEYLHAINRFPTISQHPGVYGKLCPQSPWSQRNSLQHTPNAF